MDTVIVSEIEGKKFNKSKEEVVKCELCDNLTTIHTVSNKVDGDIRIPTGITMLKTKRCDRCWELESRINSDVELAKKIMNQIKTEGDYEKLLIKYIKYVRESEGTDFISDNLSCRAFSESCSHEVLFTEKEWEGLKDARSKSYNN